MQSCLTCRPVRDTHGMTRSHNAPLCKMWETEEFFSLTLKTVGKTTATLRSYEWSTDMSVGLTKKFPVI